MSAFPTINIEKLKADMRAAQKSASGTSLSNKATDNANPDLFRNTLKNGQDKRITAQVLVGIAYALGRSPLEYVDGYDPTVELPNSTVLTATFAMLLDSIDVDPNQDGRAQKLARSFPDALKQMITLHEGTRHQIETYPEADAHVRDEDQPEA